MELTLTQDAMEAPRALLWRIATGWLVRPRRIAPCLFVRVFAAAPGFDQPRDRGPEQAPGELADLTLCIVDRSGVIPPLLEEIEACALGVAEEADSLVVVSVEKAGQHHFHTELIERDGLAPAFVSEPAGLLAHVVPASRRASPSYGGGAAVSRGKRAGQSTRGAA